LIVILNSQELAEAGKLLDRYPGADVRQMAIKPGVELNKVADLVVDNLKDEEKKKPEGLIDLLVIHTHGAPGEMYLSGDADFGRIVNADSAEHFAGPFAKLLKPHSKGGRGVELYGAPFAAPLLNPRNGKIEDELYGLRFITKLSRGFKAVVCVGADYPAPLSEAQQEDAVIKVFAKEYDDLEEIITIPMRFSMLPDGSFRSRKETILEKLARESSRKDFVLNKF
jgi:hypothetical protein